MPEHMIKLPRRLLLVCCTLLFHLLVTANPVDDSVVEGLSLNDLINRIKELRTEDSEKALELCEKGLEFYKAKKDTLSCINLLIAESKVYGHKAQYQTSYDRNWKAYLLANESNNKVALIDTKISIGRYYSFYKRKDEAFKYLKEALALNKELLDEGKVEETSLIRNYYLIAKTYRELSNPTLAKIYLDSCYLHGDIKIAHLGTNIGVEEAILSDDPQAGIDKLNKLLPDIAKTNKGYQVLIYKYIGDKYLELGKTDEAEKSLLKSIDLSMSIKVI